MTLTADGWFDWAIRVPGPANRVLSAFRTPVDLYVHHSMVGSADWFPGQFSTLFDDFYYPRAWHWTISNPRGMVYQHYPIWTHLQHGHAANVLGPGGELTGGFVDINEKISTAALPSVLRIHADINEWRAKNGKPALTRDFREPGTFVQASKRGWVEHREMAPYYNTTQCPSARYAPLWDYYKSGGSTDDMSAEDIQRLNDVYNRLGGDGGKHINFLDSLNNQNAVLLTHRNLLGGYGIDATVTDITIGFKDDNGEPIFPPSAQVGETHRLTGAKAVVYANSMGFSVFLGLSGLNAGLHGVIEAVEKLKNQMSQNDAKKFTEALQKALSEIDWSNNPN